jgi:hypothetical protein
MRLGSRPSTAPYQRPSSAFEQRPLGRSPLPVRLQAAVSSNNVLSSITSLKGEILLLQRRVEEARGTTANAEMESLEKRLMAFPKELDETSILEAKTSLMEILLELIKNLSISALERSDPTVVLNLLPTRTSAFLNLVDYVTNLGARRRVWDERVGEGASVTAAESAAGATAGHVTQRGSTTGLTAREITTLDLALNEPTAAEVRKLAAEQRVLQEQLKAVLERQVGHHPAASSSTKPQIVASQSGSALKDDEESPKLVRRQSEARLDTGKLQLLQKQVEALTRENEQFKKRVAELEAKATAEGCTLPQDEVPEEILKRIRGLSFGCDAKRLLKMDIPLGTRPVLSEQESAMFAARMALVFSDAPLSSSSSPEPSVTRAPISKPKTAKVEASNEPALWFALQQQSLIVTELCNRVESSNARYDADMNEKACEIERLGRVVTTLEQRIQAIKLQNTKATLSFEAESSRLTKDIERYKKLLNDFMVQQSTNPHRIVNAKGQIATAEEREKTLREEVSSRQQSIGDLTEQLKALKTKLDQEKESSAAISRERQSLLHLRSSEASKVTRLVAEAHERQEEIERLKEQVVILKKEMREKTVAETELREKAWKLDVEHHIAQNVITELRQREKTIMDQCSDALQIQKSLQLEVNKLRDELVEQSLQNSLQVQAATNEKQAAKAMLLQEQRKIEEMEKEMEQLRVVALRMESLEQNFTNYAASKLAQREAGEEEQRALNESLEALEANPFFLPCANDGEGQLQLLQKRLAAAKEQFENDDRIRSRAKATQTTYTDDRSVKKKLATVLQHRYTCIQLTAVEDRLRQLALEQKNREQEIEIKELNGSQEALLADLAQVRVQCDSLAQRNMELELERKMFMKTRAQSEADIRNLKSNVQRLRVGHEEQEKLLIDVGSRLQSSRMALDIATGSSTPLLSALPDEK